MLGFRKRKQIETNKADKNQLTLVFDNEMGIPKEDEYVFRYHAKRLPALLDNQLSIELLHAEHLSEGLSIIALFRNTLPDSFEIDELPVLVLNADNIPLGRKVLSRVDLPNFESRTSKPVYIDFFENELFSDLEMEDLKTMRLVFQMNPIDRLQKNSETERNDFSPAAWRQLARTNVLTPPVGENEFNMMLVQTEKVESSVTTTLLLRNGYEQDLNVEQLPLELVNGETVAGFTVVRMNEPVRSKHAYPISVVFENIEGEGPFTVQIRQ